MTYTKSKCIYSTPIFTAVIAAVASAINVAIHFECVFVFKLISLWTEHTYTVSKLKNQQQESVRAEIQLCTAFYIQSYWMPP